MRRRLPVVLALAMFAVWCAVETTNVVFLVLTWNLDRGTFGESPRSIGQGALTAAAFAVVGLLLGAKRPQNAIGWIFLAIGMSLAAGMDNSPSNLFGRYALYASAGHPLPAAALAASLAQVSWVILFSCVALLLLLFPDGRLPSRRWRGVVALLVVSAVAVWIGVATAPGPVAAPFGRYVNPLGVGVLHSVDRVLAAVAYVMLIPLAAAAASLIQRLRRSSGVERQQYALFTMAAAVFVVGLVATQIVDAAFGSTASDAVSVVPSVAAALLPIATAIAILRYRLYEIDHVISRTLVYGALTVILGAAYAGLVLAGQAVFSSFAGGSNLAIAVSTLVVAALFLPVRARVQAFVDRRFYRRRYDAQRTLEAFGARLREPVELGRLTGELGGIVDETMQPAHVSVWLRAEAR